MVPEQTSSVEIEGSRTEYNLLKADYDKLASDFETLRKENQALVNSIRFQKALTDCVKIAFEFTTSTQHQYQYSELINQLLQLSMDIQLASSALKVKKHGTSVFPEKL